MDPWSDEAPSKWLGQQAGCAVAVLAGLVGALFLVAAFAVFALLAGRI